MKFSEGWLREFIDPPVSTAQLVEQLTLLGLEVGATTPAAPYFSDVVVARVLDVRLHPEAEKLRICTVEDGSGKRLQVVCGAPNVRTGGLYPFARLDATLPDDIRIKKASIRGIESHGMLCSAAELGMNVDTAGLLSLPAEAPLGMDFRQYLDLDDQVIEVDLTPNRGDCLSVLGIAREVGVSNGAQTVRAPEAQAVAASISDRLPISVQAPEACPRYVGRVIKGIRLDAQTPLWMLERLRRSGIRSIHPVVDVSNYVMLEWGQPMHGFDMHKLAGGVVVRLARQGEEIQLLNGSTTELHSNTLVIADEKKVCAVAGIMGGQETAVTQSTTDVLFESAYFTAHALAGRARQYGLHTDSSHRFERGVDCQLQVRAMERATRLLIEMAGGEAGPVVTVESPAHLPVISPILLRRERIKKLLGAELESAFVSTALLSLGLRVSPHESGWDVTPSSYRYDLRHEADLIEELARIKGYTYLPRRLPAFIPGIKTETATHISVQAIDQVLINRGYQEVITYSFTEPELQEQLDPDHKPLVLANPISSEMAAMRTNLWPGLITTLKYNLNRQQKRLQIYEKGLRFIPQPTNLKQENVISGLRYGSRYEEHWDKTAIDGDFYDIKADVEALLALSGRGHYQFEPCQQPMLHPGQSAKISRDGVLIGYVGAIHPEIIRQFGWESAAFVFELVLAPLQEGKLPKFTELSRFTRNRRDLAILVNQEVQWRDIEKVVRSSASGILQDVQLFDVYTGGTLTTGLKSIAMGLILQEISRTLTDSEIDAAVDRVLMSLNKSLGATLRE